MEVIIIEIINVFVIVSLIGGEGNSLINIFLLKLMLCFVIYWVVVVCFGI